MVLRYSRKLRVLRKELAAEDGVALYNVFNQQLAQIDRSASPFLLPAVRSVVVDGVWAHQNTYEFLLVPSKYGHLMLDPTTKVFLQQVPVPPNVNTPPAFSAS